jgi:hypothetical protein
MCYCVFVIELGAGTDALFSVVPGRLAVYFFHEDSVIEELAHAAGVPDRSTELFKLRTWRSRCVGPFHATVIYGIAEAASGHCLLARFPGLVDSLVAVLRSSSAKYRRPASPDGEIRAWGDLSEAAAAKFYERLTSRGRASVDIEVTVTQGDTELFGGTFGWFVSARES